MTTTGASLLTGLSRYLGELDFPAGLTTTAAGDTVTLVDTALSRFDDDYLVGWYIRITENVNGNQYLSRRITNFVGSTGTVTVSPAFAGATGSGTEYELHRHNPEEKFSALDEGRIAAYPALGKLTYDDTTTGDGRQRLFDIPTSIRRGPVQVFVEDVEAVQVDWNFLSSPLGNSTTGWTASSVTAATVAQSNADLLIPKYTDADATKLTLASATAATYTQAVADMTNGITAAKAAGRAMTAAMWVYFVGSGSRIRLGITDDSGTTYGSYHQGLGWELLYVEDTIAGNNATTLSVVIDMPSVSGASTFYWQHGWFYFGEIERVSECYTPLPASAVRRDNATQQVKLVSAPPRGRQVRMVGRSPLSALGTAVATQVTNTMEVDEFEAELLYTEAAKVLFTRGVITSGALEALAPQIQVNEARLRELKQKWEQQAPASRIQTMWA